MEKKEEEEDILRSLPVEIPKEKESWTVFSFVSSPFHSRK